MSRNRGPLKIVHIISGLAYGGAQTMLQQLLERMDPGRFSSTVISLTTKDIVGEHIEGEGHPVVEMGMRRKWPSPVGLSKLSTELRNRKPDIIQTWLYHADLLGLLAARLAGFEKVIWNIRGTWRTWRQFGLTTALTVRACTRLSHHPTAIIANSMVGQKEHSAAGYRPRRWEVIPNGFDLELFKPDPSARKSVRAELGLGDEIILIGTVARFHPMKGHHELIQAMGFLGKSYGNLVLLIAGREINHNNQNLVEWVRASQFGDRILLLGPRDDIPSVMNGLDIYVQPSTFGEGFPNVVGEAMASGVPAVVTDVGASRELIGDWGEVVRPGDVEDLVAGVRRMMDVSPQARRREIGLRARNRIREYFEIDHVVNRYETLYNDVAESGGTSGG